MNLGFFLLLLLSCFIFTNKSYIMAFHCRKRKCLHTTVVSTGNTDFDNTRLNFFCCCCFSRFILISVICHVLCEMILEISFWFVCAKSYQFISCSSQKNADVLNMKKVQLSKAALFTLTSSKAKVNVFWKIVCSFFPKKLILVLS